MSNRSPQPAVTLWLGIAFVLVGILLASVMVAFWPRTKVLPTRQRAVLADPAAAGREVEIVAEKKSWLEETRVAGVPFNLDADTRLLILVLLAGALGGFVHAAQSFASYVGNVRFKPSWTWWYILRLPMGSFIAVFVYFAIRGGLLAAGTATASGAANDLNLFGIMSFSGLAGLFSKQAADKLAEVFDTLFATKEDPKRHDKLAESPPPEITSLAPHVVTAASGVIDIVLTGQGFVKDSVVRASGQNLATTFLSPQSLFAKLDTSDLENGTELKMTVLNPPPDGRESDPIALKVEVSAVNPP